jgi:hypothetical protein
MTENSLLRFKNLDTQKQPLILIEFHSFRFVNLDFLVKFRLSYKSKLYDY